MTYRAKKLFNCKDGINDQLIVSLDPLPQTQRGRSTSSMRGLSPPFIHKRINQNKTVIVSCQSGKKEIIKTTFAINGPHLGNIVEIAK